MVKFLNNYYLNADGVQDCLGALCRVARSQGEVITALAEENKRLREELESIKQRQEGVVRIVGDALKVVKRG